MRAIICSRPVLWTASFFVSDPRPLICIWYSAHAVTNSTKVFWRSTMRGGHISRVSTHRFSASHGRHVLPLSGKRPFSVPSARHHEPFSSPGEVRSELVAHVDPRDAAGQTALMTMARQRSWGSVVEDFFRHQDWKYTFDAEGRAIRRHVLVRAKNLIALGKESNRVEDARVLGLRAVRGRAKWYGDTDAFKGSAPEVVKRLNVSRRTEFNRRRTASRYVRPAGGQAVR
jgi:hypothetical protein